MPHAIQIRQTGAPEVLNWTAVDVGEPGSGQVRLRQAAAGKPRADYQKQTHSVFHTAKYPSAIDGD
jgi:NADPH:quinone reductase-like Zn-dependent oxidoreductase